MKSLGLVFTVLITLAFNSYAQTHDPRVVCNLPNFLTESSGVEVINDNAVWTHNDGGSQAQLYLLDTNGVVIRTLHFLNSGNNDWEDLCSDASGNIYVGDFGNNYNNRQDLKIYKIPDPTTFTNDSIIPEVINFSYPDQTMFPPPSSQQNYDCEGFFHYGDSLYLFSKNRGTSNFTKMYRIPDDTGTYVATLVDSFDTSRWITAADISPNNSRMVLLSENIIHVFEGFNGSSFFNGQYYPINITLTQKEAIGFIDEDRVYMTDELLFTIGRKMYEVDVDAIISSING
ncbi:MAG: hypothetical protein HKN22_06370, partial [Bacteroidia bacterium]|nr:hypothetical protein [Bacteroidia bacterium]